MPRTAKIEAPAGRTLKAVAPPKNDWLDDRRLTLFFVGEERRFKAQMEALKKLRKKSRNSAKLNGIVLGELDDAVKESEMDGADLMVKYAAKIRYLQHLSVPIGSQLTLFSEPQAEQAPSEQDRWHSDGYRAAYFGEDIKDNPHEINTPAGQAWQAGYLEGNSERARIREDLERSEAEGAEPANDNGADGEGEPGDEDDAA